MGFILSDMGSVDGIEPRQCRYISMSYKRESDVKTDVTVGVCARHFRVDSFVNISELHLSNDNAKTLT